MSRKSIEIIDSFEEMRGSQSIVRGIQIIFLILIIVLSAPFADCGDNPLSKINGKNSISVDFKELELFKFLNIIQSIAETPIVIDDGLGIVGTVTVKESHISWDRLLNKVVRESGYVDVDGIWNNLLVTQKNGIIYISQHTLYRDADLYTYRGKIGNRDDDGDICHNLLKEHLFDAWTRCKHFQFYIKMEEEGVPPEVLNSLGIPMQ